MNAPSKPWGSYPGRDPEREAEKLKRRFQAVSRKSFRRQPFRRLRYLDWPVICGIGLMLTLTGFIAYRWFWNSNLWPSNQARLLASYVPNCASARAIGIAPLYSGYPGYRASLDRDRDGIACEPYPF